MRLLIRADASTRMGTGHVMRCLALGQAWQTAGGSVEFLTRCESSAVIDRLVSEGMTVWRLKDGPDWPSLEEAVSSGHRPSAFVLDGYHFDSEYQRRARDLCHPLLVIDDMAHLPYYCADIILNQNINAEDLRYTVGSHTRLLLGCQWTLLRKEFLQWRGWRREVSKQARKVIVTVGGSDPDNVTLKVIESLHACESRDKLQAVIVAGGANPHISSLEKVLAGSKNIELRSDVKDMPSLMAWADVAITAGGSTCRETSFMALPSMTFIVADNQEGVVLGLERLGVTINLGWPGDLNGRRLAWELDSLLSAHSRRQRMSDAGRRLVDGGGATSVVAMVCKCSSEKNSISNGFTEICGQLPRY